MYQRIIDCSDAQLLERQLAELREHIAADEGDRPAMLFRILNATLDFGANDIMVSAIRRHFPEAPYMGCTTHANIVHGELLKGKGAISIVCDVFEDPDTRVEILQLPLDYECQEKTAQTLLDTLAAHPEIKAVEMLNTVETADMPTFCRSVSAAPEGVVMFGGGALDANSDFNNVVVFSSDGPATDRGIVFALYSGENFHAQVMLVQGWKPLGMPFHITRAERMTLQELNGRPAIEVYNHYLHITDDDNFLQNALCFPISIDVEGTLVLRTPISANPDGSITLPTDVTGITGDCRIAYGDPIAILDSVQDSVREIREFRPQALLAFSCVGRLLYWGHDYAACETHPFQALAPIAGFYSGGELIRLGRNFINHTLSLVVVGLREGDPDPNASLPHINEPTPMAMNLQLSLVGRMASFIGAAAEELQEAYERMDAIARTDGLTGLANRREIEAAVIRAVKVHESTARGAKAAADGSALAPVLVMLDLDYFKRVNDEHGHEAGDEVLRRLAELFRHELEQLESQAIAGRWGGEEFMVLMPSSTLEEAKNFAERLREDFSAINFGEMGHHTMSVGAAQMHGGDTSDSLCSRVDDILYQAKDRGRNCVVVDRG
ncbi:MAG: GGDEF domain-containing protein [Olsenella sp.]|nr:GGDEF domain-containing protein [Olsenella sp.]